MARKGGTYDVAIIGGGPAGSTVGGLLAKYEPGLRVVILERETFPRDHIGESQLPIINFVLVELGAWEKVEAAGFPVKIGATYRWGRTNDLWSFDFLPNGDFKAEPRPGRFAGQRMQTAFQVDRSIYDKLLLDHAKGLGCEVRENTRVTEVVHDGDLVTSLRLGDEDERVEARYYVDASGHAGVLRRALGVQTQAHTNLQNIAIWDYWRNADWAVSIGVGGTRIQVLSLGYGWLWFIPLGPSRTSLGLVVPAVYYKTSGKSPQTLYDDAVGSDPLVSRLIRNATRENKLSTTKDWSFLSERLVGGNWFLAGEACGFADPILSAGMSLAHLGGRNVAYTILSLIRGEHEPEWLLRHYNDAHRSQIRSHIRFADYWYSQNGVFSDLAEYAKEIAGERGLEMTAQQAWQWLGTGGFIDDTGATGFGGFDLSASKQIAATFLGQMPHYEIEGRSHFKLDLEGAEKDWTFEGAHGRITRRRCYRRAGKMLPSSGHIPVLSNLLKSEKSFEDLEQGIVAHFRSSGFSESSYSRLQREVLETLEAMVSDGWVVARTEPGSKCVDQLEGEIGTFMHPN